jgi:hypothetical protein
VESRPQARRRPSDRASRRGSRWVMGAPASSGGVRLL